jgi:predicted amidophosphoribosyltransferase
MSAERNKSIRGRKRKANAMNCPICKKDYHPQEGPVCHKCADAKEKPLCPSDATTWSPEEWWAKRAADIAVLMKNTGVEELMIRRKADGKYTFEITPEAGPHSA